MSQQQRVIIKFKDSAKMSEKDIKSVIEGCGGKFNGYLGIINAAAVEISSASLQVLNSLVSDAIDYIEQDGIVTTQEMGL